MPLEVGCDTTGVLPLLSLMPHSLFSASWRVGSLVLVTALVWAAHYGLWTPDDWAVPTDYAGDAHEVLARLKAETAPINAGG